MTTQQIPRARSRGDRSSAIIAALVEQGLVSGERRDEAAAVVEAALGPPSTVPAPLRRRFAELAGYVGGAFLVAAAGLFLAERWIDLSVPQQVGLLFGVAGLLVAAGLVVTVTAGGSAALRVGAEPVRRRLASVLFTAAAPVSAAAVLVWVVHVLEQDGTLEQQGHLVGLGASVTLLVVAALGYVMAPSLLGQAAVAVGTAYAVPFALNTLDSTEDVELVPLGLTFLVVGTLWLALAERAVWREPLPARVIGSIFLVVGAQVPVGSDQPWIGYLLTVLVAAAGFVGYVVRRAWPYLAVGVIGVTLAVPEALLDWTEGSLGTAGVLLVAGVTLLGAAVLGLRLRREAVEPHAQ